ncbi:uncharacterized protein LOC134536763 [Bacillus rossius redtenbacheri]|uniref:uncharacterized protein LOC134536763 n=1 Tax=Bacillus rossius redtenbacheri TaxID=93214 RepID=UPI002FDD7986
MAPTQRAAWCSSEDSVYADPRWDAGPSSSSSCSGASSPALDGSQSDFSRYRPAARAARYPDSLSSCAAAAARCHLAGVEEEDFCNERYPAECCLASELYQHDCYEEIPLPCSRACELYSASLSLRRGPARMRGEEPSLVYVYRSGSRRRKMALPKSAGRALDWQDSARWRRWPSVSWRPGDASDYYLEDYEDYHQDYEEAAAAVCSHDGYCCCCSCVYGAVGVLPPSAPAAPQHFGLSRYGHLKIDYSCSWDCLDKYIASD